LSSRVFDRINRINGIFREGDRIVLQSLLILFERKVIRGLEGSMIAAVENCAANKLARTGVSFSNSADNRTPPL
jgi:hypothetical protein